MAENNLPLRADFEKPETRPGIKEGDWVRCPPDGRPVGRVVAARWGIIKVKIKNGYEYFKEMEVKKA